MEYTSATIRMLSRLGPSGALGLALAQLGEENPKIAAVSADMSQPSGLNKFREKFPERHFNLGIAEQNTVSAAAGMALEGMIPFATTYATFFAMRAADQIKMCLGYMGANVKLVGILGGLSAALFGPTHISIEDLAAMRSIPNLTVLSPGDGLEIVKCMYAAAEMEGPVYICLTGGPTLPMLYREDYEFAIGKAVTLQDGARVVIFGTGAILGNVLKAAAMLEEATGIRPTVINMHTIKPLDEETVLRAASEAELLVSVEEHNVLGGLGGAVAEVLAAKGGMPPLLRIGVEDCYPHAGEYNYMCQVCGLMPEAIAEKIQSALKGEQL